MSIECPLNRRTLRTPRYAGRVRFHPSPFPLHPSPPSTGFTLIEMIVILVVVSIVAVALFGVISSSMVRSVDPMIRMQAIAIAQGYLEEALLQAYEDPEGEGGGGCEGGETRATYDDVQDYDCINNQSPPRDQFGTPSPSLSGYTVNITVGDATLDPNAMAAQRVDVTVTHSQLTVTLTGYRGNY